MSERQQIIRETLIRVLEQTLNVIEPRFDNPQALLALYVEQERGLTPLLEKWLNSRGEVADEGIGTEQAKDYTGNCLLLAFHLLAIAWTYSILHDHSAEALGSLTEKGPEAC